VRRAGDGDTGTNVLNAASWMNPFTGYSGSYADTPSSNGTYNDVQFSAGRVSISGDAAQYTSIGPRFSRQINAGTTVTAVVTKDEECDDHHLVFSTSGSPAPFHWDTDSARVVFGFDCDTKKIWSTGSASSPPSTPAFLDRRRTLLDHDESSETLCSALGENRWEVWLTSTTAHFTDANCGTITGASTGPRDDMLPALRVLRANSVDDMRAGGIRFSVEHGLGSGPYYLFIGADADSSSAWFEALYVSDGGGEGALRFSQSAG
jgi:hypothetical protein